MRIFKCVVLCFCACCANAASLTNVFTGTVTGDGTGDKLHIAFQKLNTNDVWLLSGLEAATNETWIAVSNLQAQIIGGPTNGVTSATVTNIAAAMAKNSTNALGAMAWKLSTDYSTTNDTATVSNALWTLAMTKQQGALNLTNWSALQTNVFLSFYPASNPSNFIGVDQLSSGYIVGFTNGISIPTNGDSITITLPKHSSFIPGDYVRVGAAEYITNLPLITNVVAGTLRNNYGNFVGARIQAGSKDLKVTHVGRYVYSGNTQDHELRIYSDALTLLSSNNIVTTAGQPTNSFSYVQLSAPITVAASQLFRLVSLEYLNGDKWGENDTATYSSAAGRIVSTAFGTPPNSVNGSYDHGFVPVNVKYEAYVRPTNLFNPIDFFEGRVSSIETGSTNTQITLTVERSTHPGLTFTNWTVSLAGPQGDQGEQGPQGPGLTNGATGSVLTAGEASWGWSLPNYVPDGGSAGQVLAKTSGADQAIEWMNITNALGFIPYQASNPSNYPPGSTFTNVFANIQSQIDSLAGIPTNGINAQTATNIAAAMAKNATNALGAMAWKLSTDYSTTNDTATVSNALWTLAMTKQQGSLNLTNWAALGTNVLASMVAGVSSVNSRTGAVVLNNSDITNALSYQPLSPIAPIIYGAASFFGDIEFNWTLGYFDRWRVDYFGDGYFQNLHATNFYGASFGSNVVGAVALATSAGYALNAGNAAAIGSTSVTVDGEYITRLSTGFDDALWINAQTHSIYPSNCVLQATTASFVTAASLTNTLPWTNLTGVPSSSSQATTLSNANATITEDGNARFSGAITSETLYLYDGGIYSEDDVLLAGQFIGDGSQLTSLDAGSMASGTVSSDRLGTNTPSVGDVLKFSGGTDTRWAADNEGSGGGSDYWTASFSTSTNTACTINAWVETIDLNSGVYVEIETLVTRSTNGAFASHHWRGTYNRTSSGITSEVEYSIGTSHGDYPGPQVSYNLSQGASTMIYQVILSGDSPVTYNVEVKIRKRILVHP